MSVFSEFTLDLDVEACVVTRDLARQIEKQLLATEREVIGDSALKERRFDLSVIDEYGAESFRSSEDVLTTGFPNTTETVRFFLEANATDSHGEERSVRIKLAFREPHGNRLLIRLRGPQAREKAIGLSERIDQLVESETIDSLVFRRREWISFVLGVFLLFGGIVWLGTTWSLLVGDPIKMAQANYWVLTALLLTSAYYLGFVHLFSPACAFETKRWAHRREWRTWATQALAGLILVDGLLLTVGKKIMQLFNAA